EFHVTGVQTCALPISIYENNLQNGVLTAVEDFLKDRTETLELTKIPGNFGLGILLRHEIRQQNPNVDQFLKSLSFNPAAQKYIEIGRASCRERVEILV